MKILAAVLLLLGLLSLSFMTYVEGRGLDVASRYVASRFTGKSNNHEKEYPLRYDNMKLGREHTVQKEKDVKNQKTSYGDGAATGEIDRNVSNDAKYNKNEAVATGNKDSGKNTDRRNQNPDCGDFCYRIDPVYPGTG